MGKRRRKKVGSVNGCNTGFLQSESERNYHASNISQIESHDELTKVRYEKNIFRMVVSK